VVEDCSDKQDNDNDGLADLDDPDCMPTQCDPTEDCLDGKDNDCDGLTDEQDGECIVK
jgi:hypothetical protein